MCMAAQVMGKSVFMLGGNVLSRERCKASFRTVFVSQGGAVLLQKVNL